MITDTPLDRAIREFECKYDHVGVTSEQLAHVRRPASEENSVARRPLD